MSDTIIIVTTIRSDNRDMNYGYNLNNPEIKQKAMMEDLSDPRSNVEDSNVLNVFFDRAYAFFQSVIAAIFGNNVISKVEQNFDITKMSTDINSLDTDNYFDTQEVFNQNENSEIISDDEIIDLTKDSTGL